MTRSTHPVPKDFHTVTPYIMVDGVQPALDFVQKAFDAEVTHVTKASDGTIWHAQVKIGDSMLMFGDTMGEHPAMPASVYLYLKDANAAYQKAINAGGKSVMEPKDQFYGDHAGGVQDSAGNMWWVATHIEDVSDDELERRARKEEANWSRKKQQPKQAA